MPWCEGCARFYNPNTLNEAGDCPEGHHVADPDGDADEKQPGPPWHFWLLVISITIYLAWRLIQGIGWLIGHL